MSNSLKRLQLHYVYTNMYLIHTQYSNFFQSILSRYSTNIYNIYNIYIYIIYIYIIYIYIIYIKNDIINITNLKFYQKVINGQYKRNNTKSPISPNFTLLDFYILTIMEENILK